MTKPCGEMAGRVTGSFVMGSTNPGNGLVGHAGLSLNYIMYKTVVRLLHGEQQKYDNTPTILCGVFSVFSVWEDHVVSTRACFVVWIVVELLGMKIDNQ